jgi:hypothetical protein
MNEILTMISLMAKANILQKAVLYMKGILKTVNMTARVLISSRIKSSM